MDYIIAAGLGFVLLFQSVILNQLAQINGKADEMSTQGDAIKAVVDKIRTAVEALVARLSDNVTGEEATAIKAAGDEISASLDLIDKDEPGGPIEGDEPVE